MQPYIDQSSNEYSIHCLIKEDLEAIHSSLVEQLNRSNTVGGYLHPDQKKRVFNLISKIENEIR